MLVSKPVIIPAVTFSVLVVPSDIVASIVKFVTSNGSPTLYSVLWSVLLTAIELTTISFQVAFTVIFPVTFMLAPASYFVPSTSQLSNSFPVGGPKVQVGNV